MFADLPKHAARRGSARRAVSALVSALVGLAVADTAWMSLCEGHMQARRGDLVRRHFFGDLFGEEKTSEVDDTEYEDDEPGRGGSYAPEGFDRRKMLFDIVRYPHPALREKNEEIKVFDRRLRRLADNLFDTLYATGDGIGLAAPQVGVNLRVMVYNPSPSTRDDETVFVNPRIIAFSDEKDWKGEGCLSFPRIRGNVQRPVWVDVEAVDWDGKPFQRRIDGFEARLFQHEFDHLDGVVFTDRFGGAAREKVEPDLDFFVKDFGASFPELTPAL
mmetsp:Transcript_35137/g.80984  ORF Transcript_35137/g.80984 Transcript_35137/m.80984 type:complete len:274 (+) Transcript_35137:65-886(+)